MSDKYLYIDRDGVLRDRDRRPIQRSSVSPERLANVRSFAPKQPQQGTAGDGFRKGDRVVWKGAFGVEFLGTVYHVTNRYTVLLDDGTYREKAEPCDIRLATQAGDGNG